MKRKILHLMAAIIVLAMTAAMATGCKDGSGDADAELSDFVYMPEAVRLPEGIGMVFANGVAVSDDRIFIAASASSLNEHTGEYYTHFELYSRMFDRSSFQRMLGYKPPKASVPEASGWSRIDAICASGDGNLWVSEQWQFGSYDLPDGFDPERDNYEDYEYIDHGSGTALRKLDSEGAEILSVDLSGISGIQASFYVQSLNADGAGNVYMTVADSSTIFVLDDAGKFLFQLDTGGRQADRLIRMPDGALAFMDGSGISGQVLRTIDIEAKTFGDTFDIPGIAQNARIFSGNGEFDLLASDSDSLYGLIIGDEEPEKLIDWADIELYIELSGDSTEEGVTILPDGSIIRISNAIDPWAGGFKAEFVLLTAIPRSELPEMPEKTVLTLATFNASRIRNYIMHFNRTNPSYRIEVTDYMRESGGYEAGQTRLNTEIITGNIPDILDVTDMPYMQYAARGLFTDLYPLIDSDPEISRGMLVESALRAAEIDGGLYTAFPFFKVRALAGHLSDLGTGGLHWTMDEFLAVLDAHPDADMPLGGGWFRNGVDREAFLRTAISFDIEQYIDWENGTVSFDSEQFISLLEYADMLPAELDNSRTPVELIRSGRQIMEYRQFSGAFDIQYLQRMFSGEIAIKGFPASDSRGISLSAGPLFAMTADSENKDGAWAFIRSIFGDKRQSSLIDPGFPVNKESFNAHIQQQIWQSENWFVGGGLNLSDGTRQEFDYERIKQNEVDLLMSIIDSAAIMTSSWQDWDIGMKPSNISLGVWDIVIEGALDYWSGTCSAEEAARVIQSRASILVSEQSG